MSTLMSSLLSLRWFALNDGLPKAEQRHGLHYPLSPMPRIAALGWRFLSARNLTCFPEWTAQELEAAAPETLAASHADLALVAALRKEGLLRLAALAFPLVALLRPSDEPLTEANLDDLWNQFGLPIRQQIRDPEGRLLAYDCEAGGSFHLASPSVSLPGMTSCEDKCPCGDPAPKLQTTGLARASTVIL